MKHRPLGHARRAALVHWSVDRTPAPGPAVPRWGFDPVQMGRDAHQRGRWHGVSPTRGHHKPLSGLYSELGYYRALG